MFSPINLETTYSKVCIKTAGGNYLVEKRNGGFNVGGTDEAEATRWVEPFDSQSCFSNPSVLFLIL